MKHTDACPSREDLQKLLDDDKSLLNAETLSIHIQSCSDCQNIMEQLTSNDALPLNCAEIPPTRKSSPALLEIQRRLKGSESPFTPHETDSTITDQTDRIDKPTFPDESPQNETLSQMRISKYNIIQELGAGSSGIVYQAFDTELSRPVAIKMLRRQVFANDDQVNRLRREARSVASLSHPNILSLYEIGQRENENPFLVFEFVDGKSLGQILQDEKILKPRRAAELIRSVATGLDSAHGSGMIHRDIKPTNIIIQRDSNQPKIVDFGLAIDHEYESKLTKQGMIAGTPTYMSPEQVQPDNHLDHRTDIYSLGIVLYECLTGEVPFRGVVKTTLNRIASEIPVDPVKLNSSVPKDLATITLKAISKDPNKRYQSAVAMAEDLERWLENKPIQARPVSKFEHGFQWCRRNPLSAALVFLVVLLGLTLVIGSLATASKMASANREVKKSNAQLEKKSAAVARQRDALLESMQNLIYRINDSMENDVVDLDKTQKELLRIAINGLKTVSREANDSLSQQSAAAAHYRLANVLYRLEELRDANKHLKVARQINAEILASQSNDTNAQILGTRILWLQASLDYESDPSETSIEKFELARNKTRQWIKQQQIDKGLLLDAILSLDQLADIRSSQNQWNKAKKCYQEMISYADKILENKRGDLWASIVTHQSTWALKISAWENLADLAWTEKHRLEAAKYDLLVDYHSVLMEMFESMVAEIEVEHLADPDKAKTHFKKLFPTKIHDEMDSDQRLELAQNTTYLREYYLANGDLNQALKFGRQCVKMMKSLQSDSDLTSNYLMEMINDSGRVAVMLSKLGKQDEATRELASLRQFVERMSKKIEHDAAEIERWLARLDYIQTIVQPNK